MLKRVQHVLVKNSPSLLTAVAVSGVISTAYLAVRASFRAGEIIRKDVETNDLIPNRKERYKHNTKLVWKECVPVAVSGGVTIAAIVGSNRIVSKRGAAVQAALVLSEKAYSEYRDKVIEQYGERKDRMIQDEIAEKHIRENPPALVIGGQGQHLLCEDYTGRYFTSDIESIRRAKNVLNELLLKHDRMSLDDWYDLIGLARTTYSSEIGWWSDKLMELEFTAVMTDDGRPCLSFKYNYTKPIYGGSH